MILTRPRLFPFDGPDDEYVRYLKDVEASVRREIEAWGGSLPSPPQEAYIPDDLKIVPFDLDHLSTRLKPKPNSIPPKPVSPQPASQRWKRELDAFLASLPAALSSLKKGIESNENTIVVDALLATSTVQTHSPSAWTDKISSPTCSETAKCYAVTTRIWRSNAQFALLCARFREVILGCLSEVLHEDKGYEGLSNSVLQECFEKADEECCRRLRRGARFARKCIHHLSSTKWKHQGSELIYFSGRTLDQYARIAESKNSFGLFKKYLSNLELDKSSSDKPSSNTPSSNTPSNDIPISIPCMIKCLVGDYIGLNKICEWLDYDFEPTLDVLVKWYVPKFGLQLEEAKQLASRECRELCDSGGQRPQPAVACTDNVEQNSHPVSAPAPDTEVLEPGAKRQCRAFETSNSDPKTSDTTVESHPPDSLNDATQDDTQSQDVQPLYFDMPEWADNQMAGVWHLDSPDTIAARGTVFELPEWGLESMPSWVSRPS